jgi:hypothetical protein
VITVGRTFEFAAAQNLDAVIAHDPGDAALTDLDTQLFQFLRHTRTAIATQGEPVLFADMSQQDHVPSLTQ